MSPDFQSASTVHDFQDGLLDLSSGQFSLVAIVAQGAILLERATLVAAQWQAGRQYAYNSPMIFDINFSRRPICRYGFFAG